MIADPEVSVVVPTCNRAERLPRLIAALECQVGAPPFEVVIVDDGSQDETWSVLLRSADSCTVKLTPIRLDTNRGPAAARNAGWRATATSIVAFTDDDCLPQPQWLAALAERIKDVDVVQGRTVRNPHHRERLTWFSHSVEVDYERGFYETCNIAYRRDLLEKTGGFDEGFYERGNHRGRACYGDDTDLGWRAKSMGARSSFEPRALVWHDIHPGGLVSRLRLLPRQEGLVLAVRRHPGIRKSFDNPWFYQRAHPRAIVLMAGITQLALRPRSLAGWVFGVGMAIPWFRHRASMVSRSEWARLLPRIFVLDVAETAVFARASLRYRTWLL